MYATKTHFLDVMSGKSDEAAKHCLAKLRMQCNMPLHLGGHIWCRPAPPPHRAARVPTRNPVTIQPVLPRWVNVRLSPGCCQVSSCCPLHQRSDNAFQHTAALFGHTMGSRRCSALTA